MIVPLRWGIFTARLSQWLEEIPGDAGDIWWYSWTSHGGFPKRPKSFWDPSHHPRYPSHQTIETLWGSPSQIGISWGKHKKKNPQIMITDDSSGKVTCNWKSRTWCRKPPMKMVCYIVSSRPGKLRIDFAKPKQNHSEEEPAEISITASGKIWALRTMGFQWNATRGLKKNWP